MRRLRPPPGKVHQLKPPTRINLTVEEQQTIARRRAVVDLPITERDFMEIWGKERPLKRKRPA